MEKKYAKNNKFKAFMKRNMYYIIMGVCVIAIGAMITVAVVVPKDNIGTPNDKGGNTVVPDDPTVKPNPDPDVPIVKPEPIVFSLPLASGTVMRDFVDNGPVYWQSLNQYSVHEAIDYSAAEGAMVTAVYKGKVLAVTYDPLNGNVVKIDHGDGLVTTYSSLGDPLVAEGQTVEKGTQLGAIGISATNEMSDGAHLHFAVYKNNAVVNPYDYLPTGDK